MLSPKVCLALSGFAMLCLCAAPVRAANLPEIGTHEPILIVEKNVNPQNKLVIYTKLGANRRFLPDPADRSRPMLDFYWLMDGRSYKPVNGLIKTEIRKRFLRQWGSRDGTASFLVDVQDLKEVKSDLKEPRLEICARETPTGWNVEAQMNLGPSDGNVRIKLTSIYTEGRTFPPAVESVTLKGEEVLDGSPTGRKISRTYFGARRAE